MNPERSFQSQTFTNQLVTWTLFLGMILLLFLLGYFLAGTTGLLWAGAAGWIGFTFSRRMSPVWVMRMFRARPLAESQAPDLYADLRSLAARA